MPKRPASVRAAALLSVAFLAAAATTASAQMPPKSGGIPPSEGPRTSAPVNFASPLRSFTIFDKTDESSMQKPASPRSRFLPKFRAGLMAESAARDALAAERRAELAQMGGPEDPSAYGERWAELEEAREEVRRGEDEVRVEMAYDRATARFNKPEAPSSSSTDGRRRPVGYQFVGVVNAPAEVKSGKKDKVTWYARPKTAESKWSVRLLHVDRDAIVRDMFVNGKVDVFGKYVNTGKTAVDVGPDGQSRATRMPIIEGQYTAKKRSWKNLWNFSPKHLFTDSSGMLWRERRLTPGLYTDGKVVYESAYRYSDGRSGMKPVSNLDSFLQSSTIKTNVKENLLQRLKEDSPDVVVEQ